MEQFSDNRCMLTCSSLRFCSSSTASHKHPRKLTFRYIYHPSPHLLAIHRPNEHVSVRRIRSWPLHLPRTHQNARWCHWRFVLSKRRFYVFFLHKIATGELPFFPPARHHHRHYQQQHSHIHAHPTPPQAQQKQRGRSSFSS